MKIKRGIWWQESSAPTKLHKEGWKEKLVKISASVVFDVLCAILFLVSALNIGKDVYALWELPNGFWGLSILIILGVAVGLEVVQYLKKPTAALARMGFPAVVFLGFLVYFLREEKAQEFCLGLFAFLEPYIEGWNAYYGKNLQCPVGDAEFVPAAVGSILLAVLFIQFYIAKLLKKNMIMAILPLLLLWSELLIGRSPAGTGVLLLFAGILLAGSRGFEKTDLRLSPRAGGSLFQRGQFFVWVRAAAGILILCVVMIFAGKGVAEKQVLEYSETVKVRVRDTIDVVTDKAFWENLAMVSFPEDKKEERLDNSAPKFADIPIFKVSLQKKPKGHFYLKGFYADVYEDGLWVKDEKSFAQFCKELGVDEEQMMESVLNLGMEKVKENYLASDAPNSTRIVSNVTYRVASVETAYLPYFADVNTDVVKINDEGAFVKSRSQKGLSFALWQYNRSYEEMAAELAKVPEREWEAAYEDYVTEHYLEVPENMPNVEALAAMLKEQAKGDRLESAELVTGWLQDNTTYSLKPPKLPANTDPIEYFLGTSQKGYCMHYASAAVMVLRKMGVPARLASGYAVKQSSIQRDEVRYEVTVLDSNAHAWAEIYLDGIGWIPIEVTKGYYLENVVTLAQSDTGEGSGGLIEGSAATGGAVQGGAIEQESETQSEDLTEEPGETREPEETQEPEELKPEENHNADASPLPGQETTGQIIVRSEESPTWTKFAVIILIMLVLLLILCFAFINPAIRVHEFFGTERAYHRGVRKEMKRGNIERAIKTMNRSVYRKLCFEGKLKKGQCDVEFGEALKQYYTELSESDWEKYMDIVKAAMFSERELTEEEMHFCYRVYHGIVYAK
ncbi:MAG: transglutaminase domain-containing protein [Lachnospiraceae bacterium]|nr:transglutaminase domain-containing protein [Lachnospiraceae bacterium]